MGLLYTAVMYNRSNILSVDDVVVVVVVVVVVFTTYSLYIYKYKATDDNRRCVKIVEQMCTYVSSSPHA